MKVVYPESLVRRRIILSFLMNFGTMILAMACNRLFTSPTRCLKPC